MKDPGTLWFGTDPERMIVNHVGRPIPAHRIGIPEKAEALTAQGGKIFRDGYMAELNVPPSACRQSLMFSVQRTLARLRMYARRHHARVTTTTAVRIDLKKDLRNAPADVLQFGCEPSLCAYDLVAKSPSIDALTHPWRYAGDHLHYSPEVHYEARRNYNTALSWMWNTDNYPDIAQIFDQYIGLPLTCLFHSPEQYQRRKYYGQAGEYRVQRYTPEPNSGLRRPIGFEYRVLGAGAWDVPWLMSAVLGISRDLIREFPAHRAKLDKHRMAAVRHAINTGENRWELLRAYKGFTVTEWRWLHHQMAKFTTPSPYLLVASRNEIAAGYRGWRVRQKGAPRVRH